jgi:hypothetical protein
MADRLKFCVDCRFFAAEGSICIAPQISHYCRLIYGEDKPGAAMPASEARLNEALCGTGGFWFAVLPEKANDLPDNPAIAVPT